MARNQQQVDPNPTPAVEKAVPVIAAFSNIIEQHATNAAFLWLLRSHAETSTLYTRDDVSEMDQRMIGHLDALISAERLGWEICLQHFEYEEAGETFVAAVMALQSGDAAKIKIVCEKALTNPEMNRGLSSAFAWVNEATANFWIERFLSVTDAKYRHLGIAACSIRRLDPKQRLTQILQDENIFQQTELHARALRLIGEMKRFDLVPALNQAMDSKDKNVRFWANWSAVLLGNSAAVDQLKPYLLEDNAHKDQALELVFNVLPINQARQWVTEISKDPSQIKTIIKSTAILGDPHAVLWLIQQMKQPTLARLAGLSFSLIAGVDLEQHRLDKDVEVAFKDNPEGDIEDDAENEDSDLPWPEPKKIQAYWEKHGKSLQPGQRYFMGQAITSESLKQILQSGNQCQRSAAALKLTMLESNTILLNTASPAVTV